MFRPYLSPPLFLRSPFLHGKTEKGGEFKSGIPQTAFGLFVYLPPFWEKLYKYPSLTR